MQQALSEEVHGKKARTECTGAPVETAVHDGLPVRFIRSRPREGELHIHELYLEQIGAAQESILIENAYFVPTPDLNAALIGAAQRGVKVQVITNSDKTNDIPMITIAGRARYQSLIEAGVEVYEWHAERFGEGTVHSKFAVFDAKTTAIGSYNLDPRSVGLNSEDVVVIEDPQIAQELLAYVNEHDFKFAEQITAAQAAGWVDPTTLPAPTDSHLPWNDPRFDPRAFEYHLIRQIEGSL